MAVRSKETPTTKKNFVPKFWDYFDNQDRFYVIPKDYLTDPKHRPSLDIVGIQSGLIQMILTVVSPGLRCADMRYEYKYFLYKGSIYGLPLYNGMVCSVLLADLESGTYPIENLPSFKLTAAEKNKIKKVMAAKRYTGPPVPPVKEDVEVEAK